MEKEKIDLENFPTSASGQKMLGYVSDGFYDNSYVGKWIFQVMGVEYDTAFELVENLPDQFFPETATWALRYHEQKWCLPVRENLSHEERRRMIYQKRDYRAPMTPSRMETYLRDATGHEVYICDIHDQGEFGFHISHPNQFKVVIIGEGNMDLSTVKTLVDKLKQSHTVYDIVIERPMATKIMCGAYLQEADIIEIKQVRG